MAKRTNITQKVLDYARDKNDFFCMHELGAFFNDYDFKKLSAIVGKLKQDGRLTMTDVTEPCKMQTIRHHFYIFNKKSNQNPKIDEDGNDNFKIKSSKKPEKRDRTLFKNVKEAVLKQTGEFCRHTIANEVNKSPKEVSAYLRHLKEKRKLKYIGKKSCPKGQRAHKFFILVNKNLKNVKNIREKYPIYPKQTNHINLGVFIHCRSCKIDYIQERADIMNKGYTICPNCRREIIMGA